MTSVLNVDTIADKAGTGPVGLTKQHATKAWLKHDAGDASIKDSFNHSSLADIGTGRSDCNLTNAMSNANSSCTAANNTAVACISNQITMTTLRYSSDHFTVSGSFQDAAHCSTQMCGDLA
jgi:hypothetical protein